MNIEVLCAGHKPQAHEQTWLNEYHKRSASYAKIVLHRVSDTKKTWDQMQKKAGPRFLRVLLDPMGKALSTEEFSELLYLPKIRGKQGITFFVGGAHGFPAVAQKEVDILLSLSKMTLPHRIALLVLMEQIYRGLSYKAGSPYHHA